MPSVFDPPWWTKPEWMAVALGIVTLGVVLYQVYLMIRQTDLMKSQDARMEEQAALAKK